MENLAELTAKAISLITETTSLTELESIRVEYLGKKGQLTAQLKNLGGLSAQERPAAGAKINEAKVQVQEALNARKLEQIGRAHV